jgi:hypothetical protein
VMSPTAIADRPECKPKAIEPKLSIFGLSVTFGDRRGTIETASSSKL